MRPVLWSESHPTDCPKAMAMLKRSWASMTRDERRYRVKCSIAKATTAKNKTISSARSTWNACIERGRSARNHSFKPSKAIPTSASITTQEITADHQYFGDECAVKDDLLDF